MKPVFIGWNRCSTSRKAQKYLDDHQFDYTFRDMMLETPSFDELKGWFLKSNLEIKKLFNTSGLIYRDMNLKDKLDSMTLDEKLLLLSSNGKLIKRPLLVGDFGLIVGFREKEYEALL